MRRRPTFWRCWVLQMQPIGNPTRTGSEVADCFMDEAAFGADACAAVAHLRPRNTPSWRIPSIYGGPLAAQRAFRTLFFGVRKREAPVQSLAPHLWSDWWTKSSIRCRCWPRPSGSGCGRMSRAPRCRCSMIGAIHVAISDRASSSSCMTRPRLDIGRDFALAMRQRDAFGRLWLTGLSALACRRLRKVRRPVVRVRALRRISEAAGR